MKKLYVVKTGIHWLLLVFVIVYIITGLGVTQYRIVEPLTLGVLTKARSFWIHNNLIIPFAVVLMLHIVLKFRKK